MTKPTLQELLDFSDVKPQANPKTTVTETSASQAQAFSWPWVWLSLGSFVLAQFLMHGLLFRAASAHGMALFEALIDVFTYFLGGLMIGVVSPRVRVLEPTVAAVIALVLTLHVGMWMPFAFFGASLVKTLIMSAVVASCAYEGAVIGERFTRQLPPES